MKAFGGLIIDKFRSEAKVKDIELRPNASSQDITEDLNLGKQKNQALLDEASKSEGSDINFRTVSSVERALNQVEAYRNNLGSDDQNYYIDVAA